MPARQFEPHYRRIMADIRQRILRHDRDLVVGQPGRHAPHPASQPLSGYVLCVGRWAWAFAGPAVAGHGGLPAAAGRVGVRAHQRYGVCVEPRTHRGR
ncbi:hypothetical protein EDC02_6037 [Micromonospora sp. Llam0]|nr:hypothetical protein EDC02_6037 [Micromonospora sp. Llam0]